MPAPTRPANAPLLHATPPRLPPKTGRCCTAPSPACLPVFPSFANCVGTRGPALGTPCLQPVLLGATVTPTQRLTTARCPWPRQGGAAADTLAPAPRGRACSVRVAGFGLQERGAISSQRAKRPRGSWPTRVGESPSPTGDPPLSPPPPETLGHLAAEADLTPRPEGARPTRPPGRTHGSARCVLTAPVSVHVAGTLWGSGADPGGTSVTETVRRTSTPSGERATFHAGGEKHGVCFGGLRGLWAHSPPRRRTHSE